MQNKRARFSRLFLARPSLVTKPPKIPESVLVVIHTAELDVLLIERADKPGYWQSVTGSKDRLDVGVRLALDDNADFAAKCRV